MDIMSLTKKDLQEFGENFKKELKEEIILELDNRFEEQELKIDQKFEEQGKKTDEKFLTLIASLPDWRQFATKSDLTEVSARLMRVEDIVVKMHKKLESDLVLMQDELVNHKQILEVHEKILLKKA
jgi:hypothetical protein